MVQKKPVNKRPAISVILPVYNAEKFLTPAIESVLKQSFKDFEFIIIDDCSTDTSWRIIKEYAKKDKRIRALRNKENIKGCATLNKGLLLARGEYIARVDNDDVSLTDRFKKQYNFLSKHPEIGIVGGTMQIIDEEGHVLGKRKYHLNDDEIRKHIFRYSPFSHPLVMVRKSVFDRVGGYNVIYAPADDYELYFRIGRIAKFANLPDILLQYRVVENSMTHNLTKNMELNTIRVRKKYAYDASYKMSLVDNMLTNLQYVSMFFVPSSIKLYIFQKIRNSK